jgi:hypothetical protein
MHPVGGLWWMAFTLAVIGGSVTFVLSLDRMNPSAHANAALGLTFTIIAVGICIICATSDWWMKR